MADPRKSAPGQATPADTDWRNFPELEKLFSSPDEAGNLMSKVEKTCRRLDELSRTGTPAEQTRAKAAIAAYGRALELVHMIRERREQMAAAGSK